MSTSQTTDTSTCLRPVDWVIKFGGRTAAGVKGKQNARSGEQYKLL